MPTELIPGEDDPAAIMACIGHVCVQWALLENNLLGILAAAQGISIDEAAIIFGGLDMKPRLNSAILLAEHHKWKPPLLKRLRALRATIDQGKYVDRRNMLIHGVHSASDKPQHFKLYTPRRKGAAQIEEWSISDAHRFGMQVQDAALEAYAIFGEYGRWKFGDNFPQSHLAQIAPASNGLLDRIRSFVTSSKPLSS